MKNSVSDNFLYVDSEEDEAKEGDDKSGEDDNQNDVYSDASFADERQSSKASLYNPSWPQSYRQSIDLYSSLQSPSLTFLGTPTLSRFGSSFLSPSLIKTQQSPEPRPSIIKPLISKPEEEGKHSSRSLLPSFPSRRSIIVKDANGVTHEISVPQQCSFAQAVTNGLNTLCGVGILSTPYAVREGGWLSLMVLLVFAVVSFYTGILLRRCIDSQPGIETYPDVGQAAFGKFGRIAVSIVLYVELYACCVEYIILESDNFSLLFPDAQLSVWGIGLNSHRLFALMTMLAVLPTVWLRDLSTLSYISAGGVVASVTAVCCLLWAGTVDHVGTHSKGTMLNLRTLPVALGLYGYCYSGHAVLPNIYTSMANRRQYSSFLLVIFGLCTVLYAGTATMGYTMFGDSTLSQFTLNMPQNLAASKIAVWTTIVNPFTKYALTMNPIAMSLEELVPSTNAAPYFIRTALVVSTLIVGVAVPFFGLVMSLIGSLLTMLVTLIVPCACFLTIFREQATRIHVVLCSCVIAIGAASSAYGTYAAVAEIIRSLST